MARLARILVILALLLPGGQAAQAQQGSAAVATKPKLNFFTASNGLGAVAAADLGLYVGAVILHRPDPWVGYPAGDDSGASGGFVTSLTGSDPASACAVQQGALLARALAGASGSAAPPPAGVISASAPTPLPTATAPYDMNAIYQSGQAIDCDGVGK